MRIQNKKLKKNVSAGFSQKGELFKNKQTEPLLPVFHDLLQEESWLKQEAELKRFLHTLDELGQRLLKTFSLYDLLAYKKLLSNFLAEVLQQAYGLQKERGGALTGRPKLYQRIELLNQEMEELAQLVLNKQHDSVQVLAKLDSIRGLLVDLYS